MREAHCTEKSRGDHAQHRIEKGDFKNVGDETPKFKEGQLIVYHNGDTYEIGKIKRVFSDGAFVYYSSGETASKTPFTLMHPIANEYVIGETNLGGCMD